MKLALSFIFLLNVFFSQAQLQKNVEVEVVGRPSWQIIIPLEENGLLLLVKSDITKLHLFRFDTGLNQNWDKEIFLDAERSPVAYTIANDHISLMFSETSGMYYQICRIDLSQGEIIQSGFELREYFVDQDYVFLDDKVLMAGSNEKGAAFYEYNIKYDTGKLIEKDILGKVSVNLFEFLPESKLVEGIWAVKASGFSNEKKKKGEFIKDAYLIHALIDTSGNIISQKKISQFGGNFPIEGKLVRLSDGRKMLMGLYQAASGDKGVFTFDLQADEHIKTYSFATMLSNPTSLNAADLQKLVSNFKFLSNDPVLGIDKIVFGGVFYRPEYTTVTERDPNYYNPYDPYGSYGRYNNRYSPFYQNQRTQSRQVFRGYSYPTGFVAEFDLSGELLIRNRIDINQLSGQIQQTLAFNETGAVSYCLKGDLATNNFNIGTRPILYKLADDKIIGSKNNYIPSYQGVKYWYDNFFIADGSRIKIEAISVNDNKEQSVLAKKRKGKNKTPASYSQVRKIIYLTKISSGN